MFIALFAISFVLALALSAGVAWLASEPIHAVVRRFVSGNLFSGALSKYLKLAIVVVGIAAGTRVRFLEEYIAASTRNKEALAAGLTQEVWAVQIYRTVVDSLLGIVWLMLAFSIAAVVAHLVLRQQPKLKPQEEGGDQMIARDSENRVRRIR